MVELDFSRKLRDDCYVSTKTMQMFTPKKLRIPRKLKKQWKKDRQRELVNELVFESFMMGRKNSTK